MGASIQDRIAAIRARSAELKKVEDDYETARETVARLWKQYWPAAESKKALSERKKQLKTELAALIDADTELKTLLSSIK